MSNIIILNGCGSSGKTSIAKAIQHSSPDLWLRFGIDTLIDMIPLGAMDTYLNFVPGKNALGPTMHVESNVQGKKLFRMMPQLAAIIANNDNNLIIEEVLFDEADLQAYAQHLKEHNVYYIGIFCDLSVMQERELLRGDRAIGLSNDQINRVHQGILGAYDFTIDTTITFPFQAARMIIQFIQDQNATQFNHE
jgi:chloramphenicol 3-O phosphotransferase